MSALAIAGLVGLAVIGGIVIGTRWMAGKAVETAGEVADELLEPRFSQAKHPADTPRPPASDS